MKNVKPVPVTECTQYVWNIIVNYLILRYAIYKIIFTRQFSFQLTLGVGKMIFCSLNFIFIASIRLVCRHDDNMFNICIPG